MKIETQKGGDCAHYPKVGECVRIHVSFELLKLYVLV